MTSSGSWFTRFRRRRSGSDSPVANPCEEVHAGGSDYIDGDCEEEVHSRMMEHLGLCPDCDSWLKSLANTVGLLRETPVVEVPESTMKRIREITRSE